MTRQDHIDRAYRLLYRAAFPVMDRWWRLHKRHQGVSIALWLGDTVLAVRHSYKPGWRLVGGGVGRREETALTAIRELREEVGVEIGLDQLRLVRSTMSEHGLIHLYEGRLETMPVLTIDRREIIEAEFVSPKLLWEQYLKNTIGDYVRQFTA